MKSIISILLVFMIFISSYGQQGKTELKTVDYRTKAKNQRIFAGVLLVSGVVVFSVAAFNGINNMFNDNQNSDAPIIVGSTLMIASLPFSLSANRNIRKSRGISSSLHIRRSASFKAGFIKSSYYPAIAVKFIID